MILFFRIGINAPLLEKVVRGHWGIENTLHWVLDVTFREDKVRYRERTGAQNLAAIRKIIHGVLSKDTKLKCGKQGKRLVAATAPQYREELLKKLFKLNLKKVLICRMSYIYTINAFL